jgi:hypothetical protein
LRVIGLLVKRSHVLHTRQGPWFSVDERTGHSPFQGLDWHRCSPSSYINLFDKGVASPLMFPYMDSRAIAALSSTPIFPLNASKQRDASIRPRRLSSQSDRTSSHGGNIGDAPGYTLYASVARHHYVCMTASQPVHRQNNRNCRSTSFIYETT